MIPDDQLAEWARQVERPEAYAPEVFADAVDALIAEVRRLRGVREPDPQWVEKAARAIYASDLTMGSDASDFARVVLDAVADDIARTERERVLAEVLRFVNEGRRNHVLHRDAVDALCAEVARLRGGEGR